jgi:hypothetical protein
MNTKDMVINDTSYQKLVNNDDYYRHIFKKTEKIISVVFYILNNTDTDKRSETHIGNIAGKAHFAHENALRSLEVKLANSKEVLEQFAQALIALDSTLRIASASGVVSQEVLQVVASEIDTVLRSLGQYIANDASVASMFSSQISPSTKRTATGTSPTTSAPNRALTATPSGSVKPSVAPDRRTRIQTILEAKGEATIKDISEIVTDCSEKTLQRELNAMIEESIVKRQGERRWSKYSIA